MVSLIASIISNTLTVSDWILLFCISLLPFSFSSLNFSLGGVFTANMVLQKSCNPDTALEGLRSVYPQLKRLSLGSPKYTGLYLISGVQWKVLVWYNDVSGLLKIWLVLAVFGGDVKVDCDGRGGLSQRPSSTVKKKRTTNLYFEHFYHWEYCNVM